MSTYFLVTTVDADDAADAVAIARSMDEPTDVPTIDELLQRIIGELSELAHGAALAVKEGHGSVDEVDDMVGDSAVEILKIVTLGNVVAVS